MGKVTTTIRQALDVAVSLHRQGRLTEAERIYRQIMDQAPGEPDPPALLGMVLHDTQRGDEAIQLLSHAVSMAPSVAAYRSNLGVALRAMGRVEEAIEQYRTAVSLEPGYAEAHYNLGNALSEMGAADEALECYRRALALNPESKAAYTNIAAVFRDRGLMDEAVTALEAVVGLDPSSTDAWDGLGYCLAQQGRVPEAVAACRKAVALGPDLPDIHSHLIQTLLYDPSTSPDRIYDECRLWNSRHVAPLRHHVRAHTNDRSADRRLRIGYVSADFRDHVCAYLVEPLLANHDHQRFEVFCYSETDSPDKTTERLRAYADTWHAIVGMSDDAVAELVRSERIDILIDLNLHTNGNRLLAFARQPAPVQANFLGYPGITGVETIQYRLTDERLDPPDSRDQSKIETPLRLRQTTLCIEAPDMDLPVNALPALSAGYVTFGSLASPCKLSDQTLELWAATLSAVPGSRVLILADTQMQRKRTFETFLRHGVDGDRIDIEPRQSRRAYMQLYHRIDIMLDTFPYNGHVSTLDAAWMGVPTVSLTGSTWVSRAGLAISYHLELSHLAVIDAESYVRQAAKLARNPQELDDIRRNLRGIMSTSPLRNGPAFAADMEAAFGHMWQIYCSMPRE